VEGTANPSEALSGAGCLREAGEAKPLQPVGMALTGHQFGGGVTVSLRGFAACERLVVEKETEPIEVGGSDLTAQEAVVAQPTVEGLDQRAGAMEAVTQCCQRLLEAEAAAVE